MQPGTFSMNKHQRSAPRRPGRAIAALVVLGVLAAAPAATSSTTRSCGNYTPSNGNDAARNIRATNTTCATARKITIAVMRDGADNPAGYRCPQPYAATRITCRKNNRTITWKVAYR
jgi:hypothetical protein